MTMGKRLVLFCTVAIFVDTPAQAVPPPPPSPDRLAVTQAFIRASVDKDLPLYSSLLADNFVAADAETGKVMNKAEWLDSTAQAFGNTWLQIKILHVFSGHHIVGTGLQDRIMIVERLTNYPDPPHSDCCTYYRSEVLVLEGRKVAKINRSIAFDTELSATGTRTDIPN